MGLADKVVGTGMLAVAFIVFIYYTTWAMITPFFPSDHPLQSLFPAREWAVRIPAFIFVVGLAAVGSFIGSVAIKEGQKRRAKAAVKSA